MLLYMYVHDQSKSRSTAILGRSVQAGTLHRIVLGPIVSFIGAEFVGGFTGFVGLTEFTDIVEHQFIAGVAKSDRISGLESDLSISDRNLVSEALKRKMAVACGHRQQLQLPLPPAAASDI